MIEKVKQFIEKEQLLSKDSLHLVAVSGGADSVCLLLMLQEMGYLIEAVHCNFHLRGDESNRDEAFVIDLCKRKHIKLHLIHFDTMAYASLHKVSIEMAARTLRYNYFERLLSDTGAATVCVAHHLDDSAETILLNLLRGTGIHGLCGIRPRRDHIARPLLCLSRTDILQWLQSRQQAFVTDSTNNETDTLRNHLRIEVIPRLNERWPAMAQTLTDNARRMTEAAKVYDAAIKEAIQHLVTNGELSLAQLSQQPSPESILFEWLSPTGFTTSVIEYISENLTHLREGSMWQSHSHQMTFHQGCLIVQPLPTEPLPAMKIPEAGNYVYSDAHRFSFSIAKGQVIDHRSNMCCLDADKLSFPLTIRTTKQGDRFQPLGMQGTRLVSDFLCDQKLSAFERQQQMAITTQDGDIIWLVDQRPSHPWRITSSTSHTLIIAHNI